MSEIDFDSTLSSLVENLVLVLNAAQKIKATNAGGQLETSENTKDVLQKFKQKAFASSQSNESKDNTSRRADFGTKQTSRVNGVDNAGQSNLKTLKDAADLAMELNALSKHDEPKGKTKLAIVSVNSPFRNRWDIMMMFYVIFVCIETPILLGFNIQSSGFLLGFDATIDIFFLLDIVLNFRTTYIDDDYKEEVNDPQKIVEHYVRGELLVDIASSIPLQLIALATAGDKGLSKGSTLRFLKLARIIKLARALKAGQLFKKLQRNVNANPAVFRMIKFVVGFLFLIHLVTCGYRWILESEAHGAMTPEMMRSMTVAAQYANCLYFAFAIASGNDMGPSTINQELYMSLCLLLGFVINAVIIGSATNLLANLDSTAVAKKAQIDGINEYLRFRKVPLTLQNQIQNYYEYLWDSGKSSYNQALLKDLPEKLRVLLNLTLKKNLISKVPLFKAISHQAVIAVVQHLQPMIVLPDELIIAQGEEADSMFFIARGSCKVYINTRGKEVYLVTLREGSFFGEIALISKNQKRSCNVMAVSFCELEVLHRNEFERLLDVYPRFREAVDSLCKARLRVSQSVEQQGKAGNKLGIDPDEDRFRDKQRHARLLKSLPKVMKAFGDLQSQTSKQLGEERQVMKSSRTMLHAGTTFDLIMQNQKFLSVQGAKSMFIDTKDEVEIIRGMKNLEEVMTSNSQMFANNT